MTRDPAITDDSYDASTWHDNTLHGLSIFTGDIANDDWRSELILDIDHIVEWIRDDAGRFSFDVVPATLTFHHATDLAIALNSPTAGFHTAVGQAHIDRIERTPVTDQKICLDRPYYQWTIVFNSPAGSVIGLGASGYTLHHRSAPIRQSEQSLLSVNRPPMTPGR